jgi:hypothetical protein
MNASDYGGGTPVVDVWRPDVGIAVGHVVFPKAPASAFAPIWPSEGEYLGSLYDIGYDRPEAHAIRKGEAFYYAFYARGRELGRVQGLRGRLEVALRQYLLLEAQPD